MGPISDLASAHPSANKTVRLRDDVVQRIFALSFLACRAGNGRGHRGIDRWCEHKAMVEYSWQALDDLVGRTLLWFSTVCYRPGYCHKDWGRVNSCNSI